MRALAIVHNGGDVNALYSTFADQLARLPDTTQIFPGHDFIENKQRSTLYREPDNVAVRALLPRVADQDPATSAVNVLAQEKKGQPLHAPEQPQHDRPAARKLSRPAGRARCQDSLYKVKGIAEHMVKKLPGSGACLKFSVRCGGHSQG